MLKTISAMLKNQDVFRPMAKRSTGQRPGVMAGRPAGSTRSEYLIARPVSHFILCREPADVTDSWSTETHMDPDQRRLVSPLGSHFHRCPQLTCRVPDGKAESVFLRHARFKIRPHYLFRKTRSDPN